MSSDAIAWNPVTRICHWVIAVPVILDFFIDGGDLPHNFLGYVALAATLFRFAWGFITRDAASFSSFPLQLNKAAEYAISVFTKRKIHYPGHNPLASWVYIVMWIMVILLGISGFMMGLDRFWGEEWLEELHNRFSNVLLILVFIHFVGLALDSWKFQRKTWRGMFTGKKSN